MYYVINQSSTVSWHVSHCNTGYKSTRSQHICPDGGHSPSVPRYSFSSCVRSSFFRVTMNISSGVMFFRPACLAKASRSSPSDTAWLYTSSTRDAVNLGVAVTLVPLSSPLASSSTICDIASQRRAFSC